MQMESFAGMATENYAAVFAVLEYFDHFASAAFAFVMLVNLYYLTKLLFMYKYLRLDKF